MSLKRSYPFNDSETDNNKRKKRETTDNIYCNEENLILEKNTKNLLQGTTLRFILFLIVIILVR